jgi:hypothetical protein
MVVSPRTSPLVVGVGMVLLLPRLLLLPITLPPVVEAVVTAMAAAEAAMMTTAGLATQSAHSMGAPAGAR